MKAAIVVEAGKTPIYGEFKEPAAASGEVEITVTAAALSNLVKGRASGAPLQFVRPIAFRCGG